MIVMNRMRWWLKEQQQQDEVMNGKSMGCTNCPAKKTRVVHFQARRSQVIIY